MRRFLFVSVHNNYASAVITSHFRKKNKTFGSALYFQQIMDLVTGTVLLHLIDSKAVPSEYDTICL
jgi:hypothetical protein